MRASSVDDLIRPPALRGVHVAAPEPALAPIASPATRPPPRLLAVATAAPPHVLRQSDAKAAVARMFNGAAGVGGRLLEVFENAQIDQRRTCMPLEWYEADHSFAEKNALYIEHAVRLASEVARDVLERAHLEPDDVDHVIFVSSTGLSTPSIDALLANELGLRSNVRRTPIWGLGCAGGAAGLSRARDFALADPHAHVLLIALEFCSLTFQLRELSKRTLVASSLFGDGAAAAVIVGSAATKGTRNGTLPLTLLASQSTLWKDTVDVMGWTVDGDGLHVVFSRDIPSIVRDRVRPSLLAFLESRGLELADIRHLVAHPGGVKVLNAYAEALALPPEAFAHPRAVLREFGNMSSPSCLFVLERFLAAREIGPGEYAIVAALGPGFSAEYVLMRGEEA